MSEAGSKITIQGLDELVRAAARDRLPPVDVWDPPYCGDIGMTIAADGTWFYQGSPIGRPRLVKLFSRILRLDPDGKYYLVTPAEKVDIAVADAPFLAVELDVSGKDRDQSLTFRTNVDDLVTCGPNHPIRFAEEAGTGGLKPYVHVRGRLEALVTRALVHDLAELATPGPDGNDDQLGLWSGGNWFPMRI